MSVCVCVCVFVCVCVWGGGRGVVLLPPIAFLLLTLK